MNFIVKKFKNERNANLVEINFQEVLSPIQHDGDKKTAAAIIEKAVAVVLLDDLTRIECLPSADECTIKFFFSGKNGINSDQICEIVSCFKDQTVKWSVTPDVDNLNDRMIGICFSYTFVLGRNNFHNTYTCLVTQTWIIRTERGSADHVNEPLQNFVGKGMYTQQMKNTGDFFSQ